MQNWFQNFWFFFFTDHLIPSSNNSQTCNIACVGVVKKRKREVADRKMVAGKEGSVLRMVVVGFNLSAFFFLFLVVNKTGLQHIVEWARVRSPFVFVWKAALFQCWRRKEKVSQCFCMVHYIRILYVDNFMFLLTKILIRLFIY